MFSSDTSHRILGPIYVNLREEDLGQGYGSKVLDIDAESGRSIIRFHSGKLQRLLEGLEISGQRP